MAESERATRRAEERAERRRRNAAARSRRRPKERERRRAGAAERAAAPPAPREHGPGKPKVRQGVVVSDKADKTISVRIDVTRQHRFYKKVVRESTTLHAHDERNEAHHGNTVRVV